MDIFAVDKVLVLTDYSSVFGQPWMESQKPASALEEGVSSISGTAVACFSLCTQGFGNSTPNHHQYISI